MPGYGYDDENDDFDQEQNSGPAGLRKALKAAEDKLRAAEAQLAERDGKIADLTKQVKSTTIRNALTDAGIDPKYARFAERDEVEPTVEAVKAWADENKDVYAFLAKAPAAPQGDPDDSDDEVADDAADEVDGDYAAQLLAAQGLDSTGRPGGSITLIDALEKVDVSKFDSPEAVDNYIRSLGAPRPGA